MLRQGSVARESLNQYQASDEGQSLDDCFPPQTSGQRPLAKIDSSSRETKSLFILFKFQVRMVQSVQMIDPTKCEFAICHCVAYFTFLCSSDFRISANSKPQNGHFINQLLPPRQNSQPTVCINLRKLLLTIAKLCTSIVVSTDSTLQSYDTKNRQSLS